MAYTNSSISSVPTAVADVIHSQFKDEVIHLFGTVPEMELAKKYQVDLKNLPAELRTYSIMTGEGSESIQPNEIGNRGLPAGREVEFETASYRVKEMDSALEFGIKELEALKRAVGSGDVTSAAYMSSESYVQKVLNAKKEVLKHKTLVDFFGDGTGVVATVASVSAAAIASGLISVVFDGVSARGSVNWFRLKSSYIFATTAGVLTTAATAVPGNVPVDHYTVESIDTATNTVVFSLRDAYNAKITTAATVTIADNDVCYSGDKRAVDSGFLQMPDLTAIVLGTTDMEIVSAHLCGLGSLVSADGRKIGGVVRSSIHASVVDATGGIVTPQKLAGLLIKLSRRWQGMSSFNWKSFIISPEMLDALITAAMSDRRLIGTDGGVPASFGSNKFAFRETISGRESAWDFTKSLFCPSDTVYLLPEPGDVPALCFPHSEMEKVFTGSEGDGFLPKPTSSGYEAAKLQYSKMYWTLYSECPAALGKITGLTLS